MTLGDAGEAEGDKNNDEEEQNQINKLRDAFIEDTHSFMKEIFKRCPEYERLRIFKKLEEARLQAEGNLDTAIQGYHSQMQTLAKNRNLQVKFMQE